MGWSNPQSHQPKLRKLCTCNKNPLDLFGSYTFRNSTIFKASGMVMLGVHREIQGAAEIIVSFTGKHTHTHHVLMLGLVSAPFLIPTLTMSSQGFCCTHWKSRTQTSLISRLQRRHPGRECSGLLVSDWKEQDQICCQCSQGKLGARRTGCKLDLPILTTQISNFWPWRFPS